MPHDDSDRLRALICDTARLLFERGHNAPGDGNITARVGPGELLATPTGTNTMSDRLRPAPISMSLAEISTPGLPTLGSPIG